MATDQFVNLDSAWDDLVDGQLLKQKERLGAVTPKLVFKHASPARAKVKVTLESGESYSDPEGARHDPFNVMVAGTKFKPDGKTEHKLDEPLALPAAGGNIYLLEAVDANGNKVSTARRLKSHRYLEYGHAFADSLLDPESAFELDAMNAALKDVEDYLAAKPFHIHTKRVDVSLQANNGLYQVQDKNQSVYTVEISRQKAIDEAKSVFTFKRPAIGLVLYFVPFIAKQMDGEFLDFTAGSPIDVGFFGKDGSYQIDPKNQSLKIIVPTDNALWHGLDLRNEPVGPQLGEFLAELQIRWKLARGRTLLVQRNRSHVIDVQGTPGNVYSFEVTLKDVWAEVDSVKSTPVKADLRVKLLKTYSCGTSVGDGCILIAARIGGVPYTRTELKATILHELGHVFGLPGYGDKDPSSPHSPDSHGGYYTSDTEPNLPGGAGEHCKVGYGGKADTATCWMFGVDSTAATDFCGDCRKVLQKVDVSNVRR